MLLTLLLATTAHAQPPLSLPAVIDLALAQSAIAKQAQTDRETSYWRWRSYRADFRPQLGLEGTLPEFSRAISPVVQPDGTTDFRPVSINNSNLGLTVRQNLGLTGGQVYVGSDVQRFDDFDRSLRRYNSNPFVVGITQPISAFNTLSWARRIEPLRYEESQRQYVEERETVARRVAELYFDVLLQQVNADVAQQNVQANAELLRLGRERFQLGRLSQSDLLLLELNLLNSRRAHAQARLDAQTAALSLQSYAGVAVDTPLEVPAATPVLQVAPAAALTQARQNRREALTFQRRLLEAEQGIAKARGTTGFRASLSASFGLANQAGDFWTSYQNPSNQQQVRLEFALPLVDWGRQKSTVKTAQLTRDQEQRNVAQEQATFEQTVLAQASQLATLDEQRALTARADSLAQRRYDIARATYQVGRISLTDLNIALAEKDQAKRAYINALRAWWVGYYQLRVLTLYDFERQRPLLAAK